MCRLVDRKQTLVNPKPYLELKSCLVNIDYILRKLFNLT